jgi:hypothetical protein
VAGVVPSSEQSPLSSAGGKADAGGQSVNTTATLVAMPRRAARSQESDKTLGITTLGITGGD